MSTDPDAHARAKELFLELCGLPVEERQERLAQIGREDRVLLVEITSLLAAHDRLPAEAPHTPPSSADIGDSGEWAGEERRIGSYRLERRLGEGGMGTVYAAWQEEPVRRRVALKLIKRGMDTDAVVARFAAERQTLAIMSHPNIAQVFDAGATSDGRPFFAMELVPGVAITTFCDERRLSLDDRLELFLQICDGVQHAHHKGIIHRDLKPSNILVAEIDGRALPKIIDFGIAKATTPTRHEETLTELGQLVGTPDYMSPEQVEPLQADVDTRSDVYALGVVLYELLTGLRPLQIPTSAPPGSDELRRLILESNPQRPSQAIRAALEKSVEAANRRGARLDQLHRRLRGDLDWIVLKALSKDRSRRYPSAGDLAADLRRHLEHAPVLARPPSARYRLGRFVRRHRFGVAAAVALTSTILLGLVAAGTGWARALAAERRALEEAERASTEAATAQEVADFLVRLFDVSDPGTARGSTITARELLDRGAERIDDELADRPLVAAHLMHTMGRVYLKLGLYEEADRLLGRAVGIQRQHPGAAPKDVAGALLDLGNVAFETGRFDEAEAAFRQAIEVFGKSSGSASDLAAAMNNLANLLWLRGAYAAAIELSEQALETLETELGPAHEAVGNTLNSLGAQYYSLGRFDRARELWERSLEILETELGPDHPRVAKTLNNLGVVLGQLGEYPAAVATLEKAAALQERLLGPSHPDLAAALSNLADVEVLAGDRAAARRLLERALEIRVARLGAEHPDTARALASLGVLVGGEDPAMALDCLERALQIRESRLGAGHIDTGRSAYLLAHFLVERDESERAAELYRRSLAAFEAASPEHPDLVVLLREYSALLRRLGRVDEAAPLEARAEGLAARGGAVH